MTYEYEWERAEKDDEDATCDGDLHSNSILVEDDGSTKGVVEKGDVDVTLESSLECQHNFIAGKEESIKGQLCVMCL